MTLWKIKQAENQLEFNSLTRNNAYKHPDVTLYPTITRAAIKLKEHGPIRLFIDVLDYRFDKNMGNLSGEKLLQLWWSMLSVTKFLSAN